MKFYLVPLGPGDSVICYIQWWSFSHFMFEAVIYVPLYIVLIPVL